MLPLPYKLWIQQPRFGAGRSTVTAVDGVATFSGLTLNQPGSLTPYPATGTRRSARASQTPST